MRAAKPTRPYWIRTPPAGSELCTDPPSPPRPSSASPSGRGRTSPPRRRAGEGASPCAHSPQAPSPQPSPRGRGRAGLAGPELVNYESFGNPGRSGAFYPFLTTPVSLELAHYERFGNPGGSGAFHPLLTTPACLEVVKNGRRPPSRPSRPPPPPLGSGRDDSPGNAPGSPERLFSRNHINDSVLRQQRHPSAPPRPKGANQGCQTRLPGVGTLGDGGTRRYVSRQSVPQQYMWHWFTPIDLAAYLTLSHRMPP